MPLLVLAALAAVVLLAPPASAQPVKWGDVSPEELALSEYPADPDAAALVLADYGEVIFKNTYEPQFERHVRIKVLREAGYEFATVRFSYVHEERAQTLVKVEGQTFVTEAGGKVRRVKLDKKDIFKEKLDDRRTLVSFTLPALEPGAVAEFRYAIRSDGPGWMPNWSFQSSEPTFHSEFVAEVPRVLDYVRTLQGATSIEADEPAKVQTLDGEAYKYRWVARNLPALRDEPHMTAASDYEARLDLQLNAYYHPGHGAVTVLNTWDAFGTELLDYVDFGRRLGNRDVERKAQELTAGMTAPQQKAQALYDFVSRSITATTETGWLAYADLDDVLASGSGTHAEIVLLFVDMARAAGLPADPVLISTRSYGQPMKLYPLRSQFNSLVARVGAGSQPLFVDPTDPLRPMGMLPPEARVAEGWVPGAERSGWVRVLSPFTSEQTATLQASLDAGGALRGRLTSERAGYGAWHLRNRLQETDADRYVQEDVLDELPGAEAGAVDLALPDSLEAPIALAFDLNVADYAQVVGDRMYVNPLVLLREQEHPFPSRTRVSDVSYAYPYTRRYEAHIAIPEGYVVEEVPETRRHRTPGGVLAYTRAIRAEGDTLVVQAEMARRRTELGRRHYDDLRHFYDLVLGAEEEVIVLRRASASPDPAAPADESAAPAAEAGAGRP